MIRVFPAAEILGDMPYRGNGEDRGHGWDCVRQHLKEVIHLQSSLKWRKGREPECEDGI